MRVVLLVLGLHDLFVRKTAGAADTTITTRRRDSGLMNGLLVGCSLAPHNLDLEHEWDPGTRAATFPAFPDEKKSAEKQHARVAWVTGSHIQAYTCYLLAQKTRHLNLHAAVVQHALGVSKHELAAKPAINSIQKLTTRQGGVAWRTRRGQLPCTTHAAHVLVYPRFVGNDEMHSERDTMGYADTAAGPTGGYSKHNKSKRTGPT